MFRKSAQQEPIAIVGMGCRFPKAENPQAFWTLLSQGQDAIQEVPASRFDIAKVYDPDASVPGKTVSRWGGFLDQVDQFDRRAFRMLPREAKAMDPQHRLLLLEVAWEALEDAGLPFEQVAGTQTSVSIGIGWDDYLRLHARSWSQMDDYTGICDLYVRFNRSTQGGDDPTQQRGQLYKGPLPAVGGRAKVAVCDGVNTDRRSGQYGYLLRLGLRRLCASA